MRSNTSLPLLPDSLWPGMVAPDSILSISQIELCAELFEIELFTCIEMDLALNNLQWFIYHQTKLFLHVCGHPCSCLCVSVCTNLKLG